MITVTMYTRRNCHLCDDAKADLLALQQEVPHELVEIGVDDDPDLFRQYGDRVPVIEVGPYRKFPPFSRADLGVTLRAARDRQESLERIGSSEYREKVKRGQSMDSTDRISLWISRNYIWVINFFIFIYIGLPFMAPTFMQANLVAPAKAIYLAYSPLCHELAFRSWFLFGEQAFYPREAAGIEGVESYESATGLPADDLLAARRFVGDQELGYKVALCQRDVAIYMSMLAFGILFAITGRRFRALPWWAWLLFGILPIALDGFSQLFSQLPGLGSLISYRESTPLLRTITGVMFGVATAWFGLPYVEESMSETRQTLTKKNAVIQARKQGNTDPQDKSS